MGAALVLLLVGLGAMAAGVLIGRYYVPDDRQLRRTARHSRAYMRALGHLIARDHDTVVEELRGVVEENIDDVEPYFALAAMFRSKGEHERAIRVHQALAVRERDKKKIKARAMYELGMDFRAAGMPRRATRAMEEVLLDTPSHEGAVRSLAALYEEQARFAEAAGLWERLGKRRGEDLTVRIHHLYVAAAQAMIARGELDGAVTYLKEAQRRAEPTALTAHFYAAAAELAAARGNFRGARERLRQALVSDPAIGPHVLPAMIAAEQGASAAPGPETVVVADGAGAEPASSVTDELEATPEAAPDAIPGALAVALPATPIAIAPDTHALVPGERPAGTVIERVLATLAEVERAGARIELSLIRAQLADPTLAAQFVTELAERFPGALAARVAAGRLALTSADLATIRATLDALVGESGALAWALRGRWQCAHCNHRPAAFSWRCGNCRRWGTLRMETGIEPPAPAPRDRRGHARALDDGAPAHPHLLGARPDLPAPTLASAHDLPFVEAPRSLLTRVGGWASRVWRRGAPPP
jgi:lipopolysaccharide biosynthesis regulator YciM|nr:hypothetical protein [Kofleriaceae bacterium]